MSVVPIIQLDKHTVGDSTSPVRLLCDDVTDFGTGTQQLINDLIDTMFAHKIAVGLAAPQLGVNLRIAVVCPSREPSQTIVICNPAVLSSSGKKDKKKESCMSLPNYAGVVERRDKLSLSFLDRNGRETTLHADGFLARVLSHEIDHLDGTLYVDRIGGVDKLIGTDIFDND